MFAFTQVTSHPRGHERRGLRARCARAGDGLVGVVAYAWMTNAIDIENAVTRLIVFAAMAAGFFMALAVPAAFRDQAAWFAVAYFVVRILNTTLYSWGVRHNPGQLRANLRLAPWFLTAAFVALAGGFVDADIRGWVWLASLVIDVVGTLTVASLEWGVSASHFAERFALIVIIALGESIVAIGVASAHLDRDATFAVSVVIALTNVTALWWAYFDFTAVAAERSLRRASPQARGPLARDVFTFFHYPIVLGIIFYAVAAKKTLEHPLDPLAKSGRWALGPDRCVSVGLRARAFPGRSTNRLGARGRWHRCHRCCPRTRRTDAIVTLAVVIAILIVSVVVERCACGKSALRSGRAEPLRKRLGADPSGTTRPRRPRRRATAR